MEHLNDAVNTEVSNEDIEKCISILEKLSENTTQVFELPEDKRIALMKAAGLLSRPNRDKFQQRRKDAKKAAKRKMIERDKHARKATGIRSAREATVFIAPTMLELPKDVMSVKQYTLNCITFMTPCVQNVEILIMPNVTKLQI